MEQDNRDQSLRDALQETNQMIQQNKQMLHNMQAMMARMGVQDRAQPIRVEERDDGGRERDFENLEAPPIRREQQRRDVALPRNGPSEVPQRTSPATPRSARVTKTGGHESDSSTSVHTSTKTPPERSPKVVDRRSPRSPVTEKKRPSRISELESQITQLQEDLKKMKDQLSSSEAGKKRAQQDAEEAKKELQDVSAKLDDSQRQLVEFSAAEENRLHELRKISQDRDRAWQSELEATQKQHSVDSAALASALSEIQRLKQQLEDAVKSEAAQAKQSKEAHDELEFLKQDMTETLSTLETLKIQFKTTQKSEAEAQATVSEAHQQLEMAKTSVEILNSEGLKLRESLSTVTSELEESRAQVNSLEEMVKKLQADKIAEEGDKSKLLDKSGGGSGESEVEKLRSALEAAKIKYEEELIQNTTQIQSAYEQLERTKTDCGLREAELESVLKNMRTEISELKAALVDKESELQKLAAVNEEITEIEKAQVKQMDSELEAKLMKSITDIAELKANLMDKETTSRKSYEAVIAELELAKAAEHEDPCHDLLRWLLPLDRTLPPLRPLSPPLSSSVSQRSHSSSGSQIFPFGHFRSYSMPSLPQVTGPASSAIPPSNSSLAFGLEDFERFSPEKPRRSQDMGNVGDIGLWDVGTRERLVLRNFKVWDPGPCSMPLQSSLVKDPGVSVNRI